MITLVTGGAGFIGSHLVEALANQGKEIIVLDNFSTGIHNLSLFESMNNVKIIKGDITNLKLIDEVVSKCSRVYHLAAMNRARNSIDNPLKAHHVNITGTLNILEAARKHDIEGIVFTSSSSVYGSSNEFPRCENGKLIPVHPYAIGKLASEHYCKFYYDLFGLRIKILRYFAVYGPRQSPNINYAAVIPVFIRNTINKKPLTVYGNGSQTRNFTYIEDTVKATIAAMKSKKITGMAINVANENEVSINEVIKDLEKIVNRQIPIIYKDWRLGDMKRSPADITKLKTILRVSPSVTVQEGIKKTYEWYTNNKEYFEK